MQALYFCIIPTHYLLFTEFCSVYLSVCGQRGTTALMSASESGHTKIVQHLLKAGANKDAKDNVRNRNSYKHTTD